MLIATIKADEEIIRLHEVSRVSYRWADESQFSGREKSTDFSRSEKYSRV